VVIDTKNRKRLDIEGGILNLEAYKTNSSDVMVLCFRKTNSKKTVVYMKVFYFLRLLEEAIKRDLQFEDLVINLRWEDFLGMVKKIESKLKTRGKKKKR